MFEEKHANAEAVILDLAKELVRTAQEAADSSIPISLPADQHGIKKSHFSRNHCLGGPCLGLNAKLQDLKFHQPHKCGLLCPETCTLLNFMFSSKPNHLKGAVANQNKSLQGVLPTFIS